MAENSRLSEFIDEAIPRLKKGMKESRPRISARRVGTVESVSNGVARVVGLEGVGFEELVEFEHGQIGMAFDLKRSAVGVVVFSGVEDIGAGGEVRRTGRVVSIPVGEGFLGRIVTPLGEPIDDKGRIDAEDRRPVEREATPIYQREPVATPLQTGIKVIDTVIPVGRGQRELILGDRSTGKTSIARDAIHAQKDTGVICIYCAIGQRSAAVGKLVNELKEHDAFHHVSVVVAEAEGPPGMRYIAPFAATAMAEYFMDKGKDVLVIYDDLIVHAKSYRELSLLLRRPPGREAFPGDIFFLHSRLLERSTNRREEFGGGSITALPIAETEAGNVTAYIPTNLISITDGQVYLDADLVQKGQLPAVDVGRSVSRVGGDAQLKAYKSVGGELKMMYSQFLELEKFSRFSTRLDDETRTRLERGMRLREALKQDQMKPLGPADQVFVILPLIDGVYDKVPMERFGEVEDAVIRRGRKDLEDERKSILDDEELDEDARKRIVESARQAVAEFSVEDGD